MKHAVQLHLYALCALIRYPEVEQVTCELWYLDQNELASFAMHRRQLQKYLTEFDKKGRRLTEDTVFKPNPNIISCKYCPYAPHKQADCKYGITQEGQKAVDVKLQNLVAKPCATDSLFSEADLPTIRE